MFRISCPLARKKIKGGLTICEETNCQIFVSENKRLQTKNTKLLVNIVHTTFRTIWKFQMFETNLLLNSLLLYKPLL
jgi:hypothetical protein